MYVYRRHADGQPLAYPVTDRAGRPVTSVAFSEDGSVLAVGDSGGHVSLFNGFNGAFIRALPLVGGTRGVGALAFSPGAPVGTLAVGDANGRVYLWRMDWIG